MTFYVSAFYKFVTIATPDELRDSLYARCAAHDIVGTILIAHEGINGTVAGAPPAMAAFLSALRADPRFADLAVKHSVCQDQPFQRMKVKVKREIVTFGEPSANPAQRVGTYVEPAAWNSLISEPDVVVIDTRNTYEYGVGTFRGALNPGTRSFSEFAQYARSLAVDKSAKVAMFCTGGIRCEKASAYLLELGFNSVFHLKGGILQYLEEVPETESLWQGECFVFDGRVALSHGVEVGTHELCKACGVPKPEGVACPACAGGPADRADRSTDGTI